MLCYILISETPTGTSEIIDNFQISAPSLAQEHYQFGDFSYI